MNDMMVTAQQAVDDGKFDTSNNETYPITVWAYARK